jgi:hypothetical protein
MGGVPDRVKMNMYYVRGKSRETPRDTLLGLSKPS